MEHSGDLSEVGGIALSELLHAMVVVLVDSLYLGTVSGHLRETTWFVVPWSFPQFAILQISSLHRELRFISVESRLVGTVGEVGPLLAKCQQEGLE